MFERFTDRGRKIIILAREEAERHQNDYLGTEHLVLAILRESDGIALMIIKKMGLSPDQIRLEIERNLPGGGTTVTFGEIPFSPRVKKVIEYGVDHKGSRTARSSAEACCRGQPTLRVGSRFPAGQ